MPSRLHLIHPLVDLIHALVGLKVTVLDKDLFPSGEAYHERKPFLNKVIARTYAPYVFHMCWTGNLPYLTLTLTLTTLLQTLVRTCP